MSKYTTEVRYICEQFSGLNYESYPATEVISAAVPKIFNFLFPIYDENHREELETKILKHYYFREIGFETVEQWRFRLDTKLNEIMPYYNEMYRSADMLLVDPLDDTDYERKVNSNETGKVTEDNSGTVNTDTSDSSTATNTGTVTDAGTAGGTLNSTHYDMYSDTPQGALTGVDSGTYLSDARKITDTNTRNLTEGNTRTNNLSNGYSGTGNIDTTTSEDKERNSTGTRDSTETVKGRMSGSKSKRVLEYRKAILNIDKEIIDELGDLFMLLY